MTAAEQVRVAHARQVEASVAALIIAAQDTATAAGVWADDARQDAEQDQGVDCGDPLPRVDPEHDRRLALYGVAEGILRQARNLQYGVTR